MKCWVCSKQARGYVHSDTRKKVGTPGRYPIDWAFCSKKCQDIFHQMYGSWNKEGNPGDDIKDAYMSEFFKAEQEATRECLKAFGSAAGDVGFTKPLGDYSEAEAMQVIQAIVACYTEAMAAHHEATKVHTARASDDPFADDDIPF